MKVKISKRSARLARAAWTALVADAERRSIIVEEVDDPVSTINRGARIVRVSRGSRWAMACSLAHELGHWLVWKRPGYSTKYAHSGALRGDVAAPRARTEAAVDPLRAIVEIVREEYEAWDAGERLAAKLGTPLDPHELERRRNSAIASYIRTLGGELSSLRSRKNAGKMCAEVNSSPPAGLLERFHVNPSLVDERERSRATCARAFK